MNVNLIIHNLFYTLTAFFSIYLIFFILLKAPKGVAKTTLFLASFGVLIFILSHTIGVSVSNSELSRKILMFNLVVLTLPILINHCIFVLIDKHKEQKIFILLSYFLGLGLLIFFILNPHQYLLISEPKMYFPNYYVGGPYYFLMLIFFFLIIIYSFYIMIKTYLNSKDLIKKNKIKYFALALFLGYLFGSIDFILVYNIHFDPLWGFLFVPLFSIPFTYAVINYELMDIKLVAKKAFIFISISAILGLILILLNYANSLVIKSGYNLPIWFSSVILSFIISIGIFLVWRKIKETDILKYQFISIITHKFRTPLTAIKWSSENLSNSASQNLLEDVNNIKKSVNNLLNLTNLLANLTSSDNKNFLYKFKKLDLNLIIQDITFKTSDHLKFKNITFSLPDYPQENFIWGDEQKIKFVLQTLIDNAVNYNKENGKIIISVLKNKKEVLVKVTDTGIGMNKKEIDLLFTNFYRTEKSKEAYTEGMGIGLFLSKIITNKHGGKIWANSEGYGKGSTFCLSLPVYN
jgi:signal transduction histidine kinase